MLVWAVALSLYLLAVFHRSSLAVAGLVATERFDISASQLASFTMLQLLVYAAMQVPVGLLVDRYGPRSVLLSGAVLLAAAQTAFAFADTYALALLARFFVGMGDAMTFICVLRLLATWFPVRRVPFFSQLTGTIGQTGAIAAAIPMTWALGRWGWTTAYLVTAVVGAVLTLVALAVVADAPGRRHTRGGADVAGTGARQPAGLLVAPRHPAGVLDALLDAVQLDHADAALGLPVLRAGRGPHAR